jgi:chaperone required for assembly of F1-ATPase
MKRFYSQVDVVAEDGRFAVRLDGRPVRTPARNLLAMPTRALAERVAGEWRDQDDEIDRMSMPLNRMTGTAIDGLAGRRAATAAAVAAYAETDLVCYWAEKPQALIERQQAAWRPLLDWTERRFNARLKATSGVLPVAQDDIALTRLRDAVAAYDDFRLVALSVATGAAGSLVIGLALVEREIDARGAFEAAALDESFQIAEWGEDAEAAKRREALRAEFAHVAELVAALQAGG